MSVSKDATISALKDMISLEEVMTQNLIEIGCYDFSCFEKEVEVQILKLFKKLNDDTDSHQEHINQIIEILKQDEST